jgi:hypothetical protein
MRLKCEFRHPQTDDEKEIVVTLNGAERQSVESLRKHKGTETADLHAQAYALRHAYREVPEGFRHTNPPTFLPAS